jgi:hypothetical protein
MSDYCREEAEREVLAEQDWDYGGHVHNWRNYIGENTRAIWATLTQEQRVAIATDAVVQAMREDWD